MCESVDRASYILKLYTNWRSIVNFAVLLFYPLAAESSRTWLNVAVKIENPCLYQILNSGRLSGFIHTKAKRYSDPVTGLVWPRRWVKVYYSSMTAALEGGEWSAARPSRTLPPLKTHYPLYKRLSGPQGRSGEAENLVPTGIRSRTVQLAHTHTHIHIYIYIY